MHIQNNTSDLRHLHLAGRANERRAVTFILGPNETKSIDDDLWNVFKKQKAVASWLHNGVLSERK